MSLAQIGLFMLILLRLLPVCKEVLRSWQTLMSAMGSNQAVRKGILDAKMEFEELGGRKKFNRLEKGIRLDSVTFSYSADRPPALQNVNLLIPAGKMTALVGPSGSGKSTLVDLLPLLRRPQKGKILFDDQPAEDYDLQSLRRAIAFVSQDTFIFNDTVLKNLSFTRPDASNAEIWAVLEKSGAREFIESLPNGLDTPLGERGVMLSGGQRQRIALARALIQQVPVLILDEPTSSLDSEVEKDIQESLASMRQTGNLTIIVIAHRLSTIRNADKIVVLQKGQIIQEGTHDELMVSEDWYARIQGLQSGDNQMVNPALL
jgi:ABC-type multidrug transport system fused ATPase/permease subunit